MYYLPFTRIRYENDTLFCYWSSFARKFLAEIWAPSDRTTWGIPKFLRNRVRNRSDFCQSIGARKCPILPTHTPRQLPKKCQLLPSTGRWCPTIFNAYGLGIVLQPIIYLFTHPCLRIHH